MPDVYLYSGEPNPNDVRLRDPTVPGAGGADGNASGATVTIAASLLDGTASGAATGNGAVVPAAASLVSGAASGAAVASGTTNTAAASIISGTTSGAATANGATLTPTTSPGNGSATGSAAASGALLAAPGSLIAGAAAGAASASGALHTEAASLAVGTASGDGFFEGDIVDESGSEVILPGEASGDEEDGNATGDLIVVSANLAAGSAYGGTATYGGVHFGRLWRPGSRRPLPRQARRKNDAAREDSSPTFSVQLIPGRATGQNTFDDEYILLLLAA